MSNDSFVAIAMKWLGEKTNATYLTRHWKSKGRRWSEAGGHGKSEIPKIHLYFAFIHDSIVILAWYISSFPSIRVRRSFFVHLRVVSPFNRNWSHRDEWRAREYRSVRKLLHKKLSNLLLSSLELFNAGECSVSVICDRLKRQHALDSLCRNHKSRFYDEG